LKLVVREKNITVSQQLKIAESFFERLIGLMFKEKMDGFDGLLIKQCRSIHTFFMRYPLDIVFMNNEMKIKKIIRNIKPWRMTLIYFTSTQVLELEGGTLHQEIREGDKLEVICIN